MKRKIALCCLATLMLLGMAVTPVQAQTPAANFKLPIVTINGKVLSNLLVGIDFKQERQDGYQTRMYHYTPMAVLQYQDSTVETVPLTLVRILIANPLGVNMTPIFKGFAVDDNQLEVAGLQEKETIFIFDLNGRRLLQTSAAAGQTVIDLSPLPAGSYVFKSESAAFKFMKH